MKIFLESMSIWEKVKTFFYYVFSIPKSYMG
jgi:hypothetical protein